MADWRTPVPLTVPVMDDDDDFDDFDDDVLQECMKLEEVALSQLPSKKTIKTGSSFLNNLHNNSTNNATKGKLLVRIKSKDYDNFPSVSNFQNEKPTKTNASSASASTSFKNCDPLAITKNTYSNFNENLNSTFDPPFELQSQVQTLFKEKEDILEQNFIKTGEVINLRNELKRKFIAAENERVDHCLALEAAEKRGKEKVAKQLKELEIKYRNKEQEYDRLQGTVAFQNREIEEMKEKHLQLQQMKQNSSSKCFVTPTYSRSKGKKSASPSKFSTSFMENFTPKQSLRDAQVQTDCSGTSKRFRRNISTNGQTLKNRSALLLSSIEHCTGNRESQNTCVKEVFQLLERKAPSISEVDRDNDALSCICNHLESIVDEFPNAIKLKCIDMNNPTTLEYEFNHLVTPLLCALRILNPRDQDALHKSLISLSKHISPITYKGVQMNLKTSVLAMEALPILLDNCLDLPVPICKMLKESLTDKLKSLDSCNNRITGEVIKSLMQKSSFSSTVCFNTDDCFVRELATIMKPKCDPDSQLRLFSVISLLLASRSKWLEHFCSNLILNNLLTILNDSFCQITEDDTWNIIVIGLKLLHRWQSVDTHWWEKEASNQLYSSVLSSIVRTSAAHKKRDNLPQQIADLLYDMEHNLEDHV